MIILAITANRPPDHKINEIRPIQSIITEENNAQRSKQKTTAGFQPQTQTTSFYKNPTINNTETTETSSPTEVTRISIPTISALIPGITLHLHVSTKL